MPNSANMLRDIIVHRETGRFYGESPRTLPLEGSLLHRRNNNVERLFILFFIFLVSEFTVPEAVSQTNGVFVNQVEIILANYRGPLPLKELHSTDETTVWRDPGGS